MLPALRSMLINGNVDFFLENQQAILKTFVRKCVLLFIKDSCNSRFSPVLGLFVCFPSYVFVDTAPGKMKCLVHAFLNRKLFLAEEYPETPRKYKTIFFVRCIAAAAFLGTAITRPTENTCPAGGKASVRSRRASARGSSPAARGKRRVFPQRRTPTQRMQEVRKKNSNDVAVSVKCAD